MPTKAKSLKKASKGCASIHDMFRRASQQENANENSAIFDTDKVSTESSAPKVNESEPANEGGSTAAAGDDDRCEVSTESSAPNMNENEPSIGGGSTTAAGDADGCDRRTANNNDVYELCKPAESFKFPKRLIADRMRSCHAHWFKDFPWLRYSVEKDAVFCDLCRESSLLKKPNQFWGTRDNKFIETGFRNWKKCPQKFQKHEASKFHADYVQLSEVENYSADIGCTLSEGYALEQANNRQVFMQVLQNIRFLTRQGLALRGDEHEGNFDQLMRRCGEMDPRIGTWLEKSRNKFQHSDHQNEIIKLMALSILRSIAKEINEAVFYVIMADEVTDKSNKEQFIICFRWVDGNLEVHEEFIGLNQVDNIAADTLTRVLEDVLIRLSIPIANCRGQCYDGASNMMGAKSGVATQILKKAPLAFPIHCFAHALNLSVNDMIKEIPFFENIMSTTLEVSNLIKKSPKRDCILEKVRGELSVEYPGFRTLCPTRWTVTALSLQSILDNWIPLQRVWQESLASKGMQPDLRGRIVGVDAQMKTFNYYFGVKVLSMLLGHSDNLSKTIQKPALSATDAKRFANCTIKTLEKMRADEQFNLLWQNISARAKSLDLPDPTLPKKRKIPRRFLDENVDGNYNEITELEVYYRRYFYNAIDTIVNSIKARFHQPGYQHYENIEQLLINAAKGSTITPWLDHVIETYEADIDPSRLRVQLQLLPELMKEVDGFSIKEITCFFKKMGKENLSFISEVITLTKLLLIAPATNATSERSGSCLRRLKNWLRTTMSQERLNHLMLLTIHKEKAESLDLVVIANSFCTENRDRLYTFGKFSEKDYPKILPIT